MRTGNDETRTINRCFMTGRTCIHEQEIQQRLADLKKGTPTGQAFVVMPFTADLDAIYNWQVKPFIESGGDERDSRYACTVERADDVWQIGFIICTKICRRIQMASLVVVDLTFDNANVFYEFGISAALRKRILPIGMGRLCGTTTQRGSFLSTAFGIERAATDGLIQYPDFGFMSGRISDALYDTSRLPATGQGNKVLILHESSHTILIPNKHTAEGTLAYSFGSLCRTAASTAIRSIFFPPASGASAAISAETVQRYREKIAEQLAVSSADEAEFVKQMVIELDLTSAKFAEVVSAIQAAGCVIVDIRHQDPRAFFWLGYLHALGTHVIPVNAAPIEPEDQRRSPEEPRRPPQRTMAFDIAGLWYAQLNPREPALFQHTLRDILGYFYEAKAKQLHKDAFWAKVLSKQPISVFLGTVSDARLNRNSLGDWDYRAAAEVTGYLTQKDYKVVLESPIIKPSKPDEIRGDTRYADELSMRVKGKNCVIIGSADINELTELVWATVHGFQPFTEIPPEATQARPNQNIDCFIAYKEYRSLEPEEKARLFGYGEKGLASFILQSVAGSAEPKRGFKYRTGISTQPFSEPFVSHAPESGGTLVRVLYGQLIVCRNPWSRDKWIIVLNGTSGPATLGMAQLLTGCLFKDFTISVLDKDRADEVSHRWQERLGEGQNPPVHSLDYNDMSEGLLAQCLPLLESDSSGFEGLVSVGVYYPAVQTLFDERKVVGWTFQKLRKESDGTAIVNPRQRRWESAANAGQPAVRELVRAAAGR